MGVNLIEHLVAKNAGLRAMLSLFSGTSGVLWFKHEAVRRVRGWKAAMLFQSPVWTPHPCSQGLTLVLLESLVHIPNPVS